MAKTITIPKLNLILNVCSNVFPIEYTSETSVENISNKITIDNMACTIGPKRRAINNNGISYSYIYG